jgi:hypothetical protein
MRSITAVEIGADTCALASTSEQGDDLRVSAAATLDPAEFQGIDAFTAALEQTRRSLKLPRSCRAVVWGLPDGATRKDPGVAPLIEPLTRAGFKVKRVVTPCNALGALARLRTSRTGDAMCWLGINRNGVAIVVIRPGKLLYSHSFAWNSNVGASGSQARLLQRYSLVAFLAPEVRRAIAAAKQKGAVVEGIVTCGNLPDLRALTMPLIEELDIEVETLDSLEGLVMIPELADRLSEVAPAIRLACAGAFARETRTVDESRRRRARQARRAASVLMIVAVLAALAGGYWWYVRHAASAPVPAPSPRAARTPAAANPSAGKVPSPPIAVGKPTAPAPADTARPTASAPPPAASASATPPGASPAPPARSVTPPAATAIAPAGGTPSANNARPAQRPASTQSAPSEPSRAPAVTPAPARAAAPLNPGPPPADKAGAASAARPSPRVPELLTDPVPKVTAILVSADRRLATIGEEGRIIAGGDTIGRRVVVGIDDKTVLLREPSGVQIRVALGGRVVGVERPDR